jgi:hypothetical protein
MTTGGPSERNLDPGIKLVLEELRDLRVEMREDRRHADEERRRADAERAEERRRADKERRQAEAERRQAETERREMEAERRQAEAERRQMEVARLAEQRRSDERFERMMREFRQDSARREAATQKAFRDIRTVGLSIVKTLNHHTRLLERIDHKLGTWRTGRPGPPNGGRAHPGR